MGIKRFFNTEEINKALATASAKVQDSVGTLSNKVNEGVKVFLEENKEEIDKDIKVFKNIINELKKL